MDQVTKIPLNWRIVAKSTNEIIAAVSNHDSSRIGCSFTQKSSIQNMVKIF